MKTEIQFLCLALAGLLPLAAQAQVNYAVSGNTAYVTNSPNAAGNIVIASNYDGYPVTSIEGYAFNECVSLTSITIPDSVTSIDTGAFGNCTNLTSVTIGNGVTSIGQVDYLVAPIFYFPGAFEDCTSLTNVTFGTNVTSIGNCTFLDCTSLANIVIPDNVAVICDGAFANCTNLTSVTIGNGVTSIGDVSDIDTVGAGYIGAFGGCTSLTNVTFGTNVTSIGDGTFAGCTSLANIVIPDSVTNIDCAAFSDCANLTNVIIGNSVTTIGLWTFALCTSLSSVTIPDSVTIIGGGYFHLYGVLGAFVGCTNLTSVIIGNGVTNIGDYAFDNCPALTSVYFTGNAPTADSTIFTNDNLTNITVYIAPGTTGWDTFAGAVGGVVIAPVFSVTVYGGLPVLFYPPATNTLQWSTNPASGVWITVSNAVTLAAVQFTNLAPAAFFRLQGSGGTVPEPALTPYFGQLVLYYPANDYTLETATNLAAPDWVTGAPNGNAFTALQVTNAPPGAVFRLH